jgi:tRNA nucleotidyltransferase/poly(A) polymerase
LQLVPKDFDLSTDALPDEIVRILGGRYKYDIHGKDFFVVVVYTDDCQWVLKSYISL